MLWPLCHQVFARPTFDPHHWEAYRKVNEQFAAAVLEEAHGGPAMVFVQDYHFALLPRLLKEGNARPTWWWREFWHIPWPGPEKFLVCPWAKDLLDGMLGNDLLGFPHAERLQQLLGECGPRDGVPDRPRAVRRAAGRAGHDRAAVPDQRRPGTSPTSTSAPDWEVRAAAVRKKHRLGDRQLIVGVDRRSITRRASRSGLARWTGSCTSTRS